MNHKIISRITSSILLCTILTYTMPVLAYTKDETVYSKLDSNGSNYNTIVNNHIENTEQEKLINDLSDLLNIKNVNGDEEFKQDGNSLVWSADGSDIYYQGESQKELPIECNIKYELDGKEIEAKELAGKSGKVKITIQYINKDEHTVSINGRDEKLYTPFVVICGTIINNDTNKNIQITNGKMIDNGTNTMVVGISLPGLQESLNVAKDKLEIPNTIEITMDSTDFELNNIVTYVTPKVIEDSDLELFDTIDEIYSKVDTLQSSSRQLVEGANTLKEGTQTYVEKSSEFSTAMDTFIKGINTAASSYTTIDDGISTVNANSETLKSGANKVNSGVEQVNSGLNTLKEGVSSGKNKATSALSQSAATLSNGIDQIISGKDTEIEVIKEQVIDGANSKLASGLKTGITSTVTDGLNNTISAKLQALVELGEITEEQAKILSENLALTDKEKSALGGQIENAIDGAIKTTSTAQKAGLDTINNDENGVKAGLKKFKAEANNGLAAGISQIADGFDSITNGTDELISGTNTLKDGTSQLADGTNQLQSGVNALANGSKQLKTGINALNSSGNQLNNANKQLLDGANTISDGVTTLAEGITTFNEEGIETICNYINGDLKDISTRLEKLQELSEQYNNFTMLNNGAKGNVKFIMIMDSIKKEENEKQEIILNESEKNKEENRE